MKKKMLDENMVKMSKRATPSIFDTESARILICHLLNAFEKGLLRSDMYEISVNSGTVNYFTYQDALSHLLSTNCVQMQSSEGEEELCVLTKQGKKLLREVEHYLPGAYQAKIVQIAKDYLRMKTKREEVEISYIPLEQGYYIRIRCLDIKNDLLDMKLYAPTLESAQKIGDTVLENPSAFYQKIMDIVLE